MVKRNDLRVIKTKQLIKNAFYELVNENEFESITISDIANKAMINRATFYLHYKDKYDLLRSLENEVLDEIEKISSTITKESIRSCKRNGLPFPHIIKLLSYVQDNPRFFNLTIRDNSDLSFYNKMGEKINKRMLEIVSPELKSDVIFKKYIKNIIVTMISSVVNQWIKTGMEESIDEIASFITKTAIGLLSRIDI